MKHHLLALVAALCAACASTRTTGPSSVPFVVVESFNAPGDEITIEEVRCDREQLEPGATLRVRGHCRLNSVEHADLYFGLTNGTGHMPHTVPLGKGEHAFDLTLTVITVGLPHVSMYAGPIVKGNNCIGKRRFELNARVATDRANHP